MYLENHTITYKCMSATEKCFQCHLGGSATLLSFRGILLIEIIMCYSMVAKYESALNIA